MKERIKEVAATFFISVTLINAAILILGSLLRPQQQFGYEVFLYPLLYGLIGTIPGMIISTNKELSVTQVVIRKIMQLLLIIVLLLAFMFAGNPLDKETLAAAAGVTVSIVLIYICVNAIIWMFDQRTAKNMTEDLLHYQRKAEERVPDFE